MKLRALLFLGLIFVLSFAQNKNQLQEGFVYVNEMIPSIHIELRYYTSHNFVGKPIDGYKAETCILSAQATKALQNVQEDLKAYKLSIKIFDAYRPQRAVNHFMRWAGDLNDTIYKQEFYPDVKKQDLFKEEYIATHSGHSRGSTLDITLVDIEAGEALDMASSFDFFGRESWVDYKGITAQQRANRMLLQTIMKNHGFRNYPKEWWHFTLKNEPYPETYFDFVIE